VHSTMLNSIGFELREVKFENKNKIRVNVGKLEQKQNYNKNLKI